MSRMILPTGEIDNIQMVIFDKDGTLINVHHYWCSMIEFRAEFFIKSFVNEDIDKNRLYNELIDNMGIDLKTKKMKPEGPVGIKPRTFIIDVAYNTMLKYVHNYKKSDVVKIFSDVDEYSKTRLKEIVKPLAGVREILESLRVSGTLIAIATTDLSSRALLAMQELELDSYFVDIAGADLVKNAKPSPDLVDYLLAKHKLECSEVVVIGDSMADLNMAKNAKCKFIGVKTGLFTADFIDNSEYIVDNLLLVDVVI